MTTHLVWLRNDLRLHDNSALYTACQDPHARVIAVFIATPQQWKNHNMSPRQAEFIRKNLYYLSESLAVRGITLYYHQCIDFNDQINWLILFCKREKVDRLFYNYQYEFNEWKRDKELERSIGNNTLCYGFNDGVLLPPGTVLNSNQKMFRIYTSFRNAFLKKLKIQKIVCLPAPAIRVGTPYFNKIKIVPFDYPTMPIDKTYNIDEISALSRLHKFCYQHLQNYQSMRNIPALEATSRLSAWINIGVLSIRQCYYQLRKASSQELNPNNNSSAFTWFNELIWREFYHHLLYAWPAISCNKPLISWTKHINWREDNDLFNAWCEGRTGYPIVDAAMQQLIKTGWMHNRLRMISASFLVKDLLIDWRRGEQYFMSQLIDGNLAANNGGWQWVASTGSDAVPYFRIFNPTLQGLRFDANGIFIRRWLPELRTVPNNYLHQPYFWTDINYNKIRYPLPIVDHNIARVRAIKAYKEAKVKGSNID